MRGAKAISATNPLNTTLVKALNEMGERGVPFKPGVTQVNRSRISIVTDTKDPTKFNLLIEYSIGQGGSGGSNTWIINFSPPTAASGSLIHFVKCIDESGYDRPTTFTLTSQGNEVKMHYGNL